MGEGKRLRSAASCAVPSATELCSMAGLKRQRTDLSLVMDDEVKLSAKHIPARAPRAGTKRTVYAISLVKAAN